MRFKVIVLTLVALFATSAFASAQILSGTVSGVVKDDQGGVLPGVLITLQGVDATQTYTTESNGEFRFLNSAGISIRSPPCFRALRRWCAKTSSSRSARPSSCR